MVVNPCSGNPHIQAGGRKMDEQYIWAWIFALLAVVLVIVVVRERMRAKQRQVEQLRQSWGQVPEREYTSEEL